MRILKFNSATPPADKAYLRGQLAQTTDGGLWIHNPDSDSSWDTVATDAVVAANAAVWRTALGIDGIDGLEGFQVDTTNGGAISIGDLGGDSRGFASITMQGMRTFSSQVASATLGIAIGVDTTASGYYSISIGAYCEASNENSIAIGNLSHASENSSVAIGNFTRANGAYSSAFGHLVKCTTANVQELGYWSNFNTRNGAVRVHGTGMVAMTLQNRSTEYSDGGATDGSEADNTLMREGWAIRRNGDDLYIDVNIGGTVKTLSLGTAA